MAEPIQTVTIRVGSRTFTIEGSPLPRRGPGFGLERPVGPGRAATVVRPDAHVLVIRPPVRLYASLLGFIALGVAGLVYFGTAAAFAEVRPRLVPLLGDKLPAWPLALLAALSLLWLLLWNYGILFGARRVRFDTSTGRMTFGPVWSRQSRPLSDIVAVQLLADADPRRCLCRPGRRPTRLSQPAHGLPSRAGPFLPRPGRRTGPRSPTTR